MQTDSVYGRMSIGVMVRISDDVKRQDGYGVGLSVWWDAKVTSDLVNESRQSIVSEVLRTKGQGKKRDD